MHPSVCATAALTAEGEYRAENLDLTIMNENPPASWEDRENGEAEESWHYIEKPGMVKEEEWVIVMDSASEEQEVLP